MLPSAGAAINISNAAPRKTSLSKSPTPFTRSNKPSSPWKPQKSRLDLAQKSLHADERKYELGAETVFFVLDAQTQLAQAELNLIQSQVNFQIAVAQLDHSTGDLLEHHHVQIAEPIR